MKAILEFDLNEPDDAEAHKRAIKALDIMLALWDIEKYLRAQTKYNENLTQEACDALEEARKEFYSILNKYSISFDELLS